MIIKPRDSKDEDINELKSLLANEAAPGTPAHDDVSMELAFLLAGNKAEKNTAYLLDFDYRDAGDMAVIHDLRIQVAGNIAQIDHLLIHKTLTVFVVETKSVPTGIKVTENGEFLRWDEDKKKYGGMSSPLDQNRRHIAVLEKAFAAKVGGQQPEFLSVIAVSASARIIRPDGWDTRNVVTADMLTGLVAKELGARASDRYQLSRTELEHIARVITGMHTPIRHNFAAKFGIKKRVVSPPPAPVELSANTFPPRSSATTTPSYVTANRNRVFEASPFVPAPRRRSSGFVGRVVSALVVLSSVGLAATCSMAPDSSHQDASNVSRKAQQARASSGPGGSKTSAPTKRAAADQQQGRTPQARVVPAALAGSLGEGEACFTQKRYDCAVSSANAVLRMDAGNSRAVDLKRRAELEQKRALDSISIR